MEVLISIVYLELSFRLIRYKQNEFAYQTFFSPISELFQISASIPRSLTQESILNKNLRIKLHDAIAKVKFNGEKYLFLVVGKTGINDHPLPECDKIGKLQNEYYNRLNLCTMS
ncbi:MAG: hypothetical protein ABFS32_21925, partial [Bacteroidota bacterium]